MKLKNTIVFYTDYNSRHGYFSFDAKDETHALKVTADITCYEYDTEDYDSEKEAIIDALSQEDGDAIILTVIYKNNVIYESEQCEAYYNVK
jgi:hypothetical protein